MAYNNNNNAQGGPFWDWVRSMNAQAPGSERPPSYPYPASPYPPHHGGPPPPPGPPPPAAPAGQAFPFGPGMGIFGFPGAFGPEDHDNHERGFGWGGRGRGGGRHGGPRGRHGRRGSHSRSPSRHDESGRDRERERENEREKNEGEVSDPEESVPQQESGPEGHSRRRGGGRCHGRGGRHGGPAGEHGGPFGPGSFWGGPDFRGSRRWHGPYGRHRHGGPAEGAGAGEPFDLSAILGALASHPLAQAFQTYAQQAGFGMPAAATAAAADTAARNGPADALSSSPEDNSFVPAIDVFDTPANYVLHVSLPGAKKEDVGVNWDGEKSELNIAGVVYRPGDEAFVASLSRAERAVGVFERAVKLEEVDGEGIVAKLQDGVLVVTVPKIEKEWTDVKRVDIL